MEYSVSSVMALISRIHTNAADFTNKRLSEKGKEYNELTSGISGDLISVCYKDFSEQEKEKLLELLIKLNQNIEDIMPK